MMSLISKHIDEKEDELTVYAAVLSTARQNVTNSRPTLLEGRQMICAIGVAREGYRGAEQR